MAPQKPKKASGKKDADRIVALRRNLGMTQRKLAAEFYVSPGAIAHWESGLNPIPGPVLKLIELYEKKVR